MSSVENLRQQLVTHGICSFAPVYGAHNLLEINSAVDERFSSRQAEPRSYVRIDEMLELGVLDTIFSEEMKDIIFSLVEEPVLYHSHIYEINANSKISHIFAETMEGFHTDIDSEFNANLPTHVSIFVYLTEVIDQSGPFEFITKPPTHLLTQSTPVAQMTGPVGHTFAWNRSFYHRAAPNTSSVRRRLLKLSIQPKGAYNPLIESEAFQRVRDALGNHADERLLYLIGSLDSIPTKEQKPINIELPQPSRKLAMPLSVLTKVNARNQLKILKKTFIKSEKQLAVTYD